MKKKTRDGPLGFKKWTLVALVERAHCHQAWLQRKGRTSQATYILRLWRRRSFSANCGLQLLDVHLYLTYDSRAPKIEKERSHRHGQRQWPVETKVAKKDRRARHEEKAFAEVYPLNSQRLCFRFRSSRAKKGEPRL